MSLSGDNDIELGHITVYKLLDHEGRTGLAIKASPDLPLWEGYGMLTAACDVQRAAMHEAFVEDEEDEDVG